MGIEAHAYSHLINGSQGLPAHALNCQAFIAGAPLLMAGGGQSGTLLPYRTHTLSSIAAESVTLACRPTHRAFQSRAPPALL